MNALRNLVLVTAVLLLPLQAAAAPAPLAGDTCGAPFLVPPGQSWAFAGDLAPYENDYDPGAPGPSCTGSVAPGQDVVFAAEVHCGEFLDVYLEPADFDGALYIVTDCQNLAGTCVAGSDAGGAGSAEYAGVVVSVTQTFYVVVDAREAGAGGAFNVSFEFGSWGIPPGACCFPDGHCEITHIDFCAGETQGPCSLCEPNPCVPVLVREGTWGRTKSMYR